MTVSAEVLAKTAEFNVAASGMTTLWRIAEEWNDLLALMDDPNVDPCDVEAELDRVAGNFTAKAGDCAKMARTFDRLADVQQAESDALARKAKTTRAKGERLRAYMFAQMKAVGTERLETGTHTLSIRQNPPSVQVIDASRVPSEYQRTKITMDVDKNAVIAAWKRGEHVDGTEVVRAERLDIS